MVSFKIDDLLAQIKKAVVNETMGVEKGGLYYVHESLTNDYLKSTIEAVRSSLAVALKLDEPQASASG
jgi:hypothetical protein